MAIHKDTLAVVSAIIIAMLFVGILSIYYLAGNQQPKRIQSVSGYYLSGSGIYVVSANATYGSYPFPTVTSEYPSEHVLAQNGERCVTINVTLRNDYSVQNPAPNPIPNCNTTSTVISLNAYLFNGKKQINCTDITNACSVNSAGTNRAFTSLNYGESTTLSIFLATNSTKVTSFLLVPYYIGLLVPP